MSQGAATESYQLEGYHPTAFMAVFVHMKGFPEIFNSVTDFEIFKDMLNICQTYSIKYINAIVRLMEAVEITMDQVVKAFMCFQSLRAMDRCADKADNLIEKCLSLAGSNLASWQHMLSFIVDNGDNIGAVVDLIKLLSSKKECVFR